MTSAEINAIWKKLRLIKNARQATQHTETLQALCAWEDNPAGDPKIVSAAESAQNFLNKLVADLSAS